MRRETEGGKKKGRAESRRTEFSAAVPRQAAPCPIFVECTAPSWPCDARHSGQYFTLSSLLPLHLSLKLELTYPPIPKTRHRHRRRIPTHLLEPPRARIFRNRRVVGRDCGPDGLGAGIGDGEGAIACGGRGGEKKKGEDEEQEAGEGEAEEGEEEGG